MVKAKSFSNVYRRNVDGMKKMQELAAQLAKESLRPPSKSSMSIKKSSKSEMNKSPLGKRSKSTGNLGTMSIKLPELKLDVKEKNTK